METAKFNFFQKLNLQRRRPREEGAENLENLEGVVLEPDSESTANN